MLHKIGIAAVAGVIALVAGHAHGYQADPGGNSAPQAAQAATPRDAAAEDRAVDAVASIAGGALRVYQLPPQGRLQAMTALVERSVDWGFVLRNSVPPELVAVLNDNERRALAHSLLAVTAGGYVSAFQGYQGEQIDVVSVNTLGPGIVRVGTRLRGEKMDEAIAIDWVVAGLDQNRPALRDLIIDSNSMLASQQLVLGTLWDEVSQDKARFLQRMASPDPWGDGQ
ncbi:ABC transporter substrate-binding protein [Paracoccus sp. TOH]|uniref:ABC transporter substrate-binding protein n=1 Tax=Paracoccus sp. TOH TaxID=1263728 RepID=UPI0025AF9FDE|nr:ABC transporter substrate-binding protein [Paracoccus sp. TOH]WJS87102.1 ABC transporter substrate-binding protein [Paracoccus sp. TOH]